MRALVIGPVCIAAGAVGVTMVLMSSSSKNKHGVDGMRKGNKNGVTSDDFRTLKPP